MSRARGQLAVLGSTCQTLQTSNKFTRWRNFVDTIDGKIRRAGRTKLWTAELLPPEKCERITGPWRGGLRREKYHGWLYALSSGTWVADSAGRLRARPGLRRGSGFARARVCLSSRRSRGQKKTAGTIAAPTVMCFDGGTGTLLDSFRGGQYLPRAPRFAGG